MERRIWRELAHQVEVLGVYTEADLAAFRLLVKALAMTETAEDMPATARVRLVQAASSLLTGFGLTPASRARVSVAPEPVEDSFAKFLDLRERSDA